MIVTELPKKIGGLSLKFSDNLKRPKLSDKTIHLPEERSLEFQLLTGGLQFIAAYPWSTWVDEYTAGSHYDTHLVPAHNKKGVNAFWGGIDQGEPFLCSLSDKTYNLLKKEGEAAFYRQLVPTGIRTLAELYQVNYRRYRNLYVLKLPFDFETFQLVIAYRHPHERPTLKTVTNHKLFKHAPWELTGQLLEGLDCGQYGFNGPKPGQIVKGCISLTNQHNKLELIDLNLVDLQ